MLNIFQQMLRTPAKHFAGMTETDDAFKPTRNVLRKVAYFRSTVRKAEKQRPLFACKMQREGLGFSTICR
jgi:hypothetical protein